MLVKHSFTLSGHRTSVALEPEFWTVLRQMAEREGSSLGGLVARIDTGRSASHPLASRLRIEALTFALTRLKE